MRSGYLEDLLTWSLLLLVLGAVRWVFCSCLHLYIITVAFLQNNHRYLLSQFSKTKSIG